MDQLLNLNKYLEPLLKRHVYTSNRNLKWVHCLFGNQCHSFRGGSMQLCLLITKISFATAFWTARYLMSPAWGSNEKKIVIIIVWDNKASAGHRKDNSWCYWFGKGCSMHHYICCTPVSLVSYVYPWWHPCSEQTLTKQFEHLQWWETDSFLNELLRKIKQGSPSFSSLNLK